MIVIAIGTLVWEYTHKLDPYRNIDPGKQPLEVQVVAQDWKWLFLYPEQGVASVNELAFPSGRPLSLRITSDTVMNSLLIPALGGQIYAMAGMETRLHLLADEPGRFAGRNMQYSGDGFANQNFEAIAMSDDDFEAWVAKARQSAGRLDAAAYEQLAKPSELHPVTYYAGFEPDLFARIIATYAPAGPARRMHLLPTPSCRRNRGRAPLGRRPTCWESSRSTRCRSTAGSPWAARRSPCSAAWSWPPWPCGSAFAGSGPSG